MVHAVLETPKHRDLIYDVGMHCGEDTVFYLRKGFRVVAFEANPTLIAECRARLHDYIERGQLTIVEGAIVEPMKATPGATVAFYNNDTHAFLGTTRQDWAERNARAGYGAGHSKIEVPAVDFGRALASFGVPYYLKIDIEGVDMVCVRALLQFSKRPDFISIESDKRSLVAIRDELRTLTALGYDRFKAVEQSSIPEIQVGPSPALEGNYLADRFVLGASGLFGRELPGRWRSGRALLCRYAMIRLSYLIAGDDGFVWRWSFPGSHRLRALICRLLALCTGGPVPGWYDTHARHRNARDQEDGW